MRSSVVHWPSLPEQSAFPFAESFGPDRTDERKAPILVMDTNDTTRAIVAAIRDHFDGQRDAAKHLARTANSNDRAAKNWLNGKNLPDVVHFLRLMAQIPELASEVRRLTGMSSDLDPEFERSLSETMRVFAKMKTRKPGGAQ